MSFTIRGRIEGLEQTIQRLDGLKKSVRNRILKKATRQAARVVLKAAKAKCPAETGWLKKSLGIKVGVSRRKGRVYGLIGPRTTEVKDKKTGQRKLTSFGKRIMASGTKRRPAHYAHLVEFGHVIRRAEGGPEFGRVAAKPFLRPAWDTSRDAAFQAFARAVNEELRKEGPGGGGDEE